MEWILQVIKRNWLVLILSAVIALVVVSPQLVFLLRQDADFRGVYQPFSDDEVYYQARVAEVLRGNLSIGNPYLYEHRNDPFLQPPLSEWIVAGMAKVFSVPVPLTTLLFGFFLIFLNAVLFYLLFYRVTTNRGLSIAGTILPFVFFLATFARPISPQVTTLFFLIGLIGILELYRGEIATKRVRVVILSLGFLTGITLFISPYYWTTVGLLFVLVMLEKLRRNGLLASLQSGLYFLPGFLPLALLYGYYTKQAAALPGYIEAMSRFGLIHTHWPGSYVNVSLGLLLLGLLWLSWRFLSTERSLLVILVSSIVVLNWQNVITGTYLQFSSHYRLVAIVLLLWVLLRVLQSIWDALRRGERSRRLLLAILLLIGVFVFTLALQRGELRSFCGKLTMRNYSANQAQAAVFNWLNANTAANSVIYILGKDYDFLLPIYTHNKVFSNFYTTLSIVSDSELEDRWLIQHLFEPLDQKAIIDNSRNFWGNRYIDSHQFNQNKNKLLAKIRGEGYVATSAIDSNLADVLMDRFTRFKGEDFKKVLGLYRVDYVLLDNSYSYYQAARERLRALGSATLVTEINGVELYKITK